MNFLRKAAFISALGSCVLSAALTPAAAQNAYEPQRGSPERAEVMNAIRPLAAELFGPPIEFVVDFLRVTDDQAYVGVYAQRPGGGEIDIAQTPWAQKNPQFDPYSDYAGMNVLMERKNQRWVIVENAVSWTEPPYNTMTHCKSWSAVLPQGWCENPIEVSPQ